MPTAEKHLALVMVNLRPGMDGASSAMLELMQHLGRSGFAASVFNFLTGELQHRDLLTARMASRGSGVTISRDQVYRFRELDVDCQVQFLPYTMAELRLDRGPFLKAITATISKVKIDYLFTADRISLLAAHLLAMPGCHFIHSMGNIHRIRSMHRAYLSSLLHRDIVAASSFLQGRLKELLGVKAGVLNPIIDFDAYVASREPGVGAVGFCAGGHPSYKGDEIVSGIIKKMPERKFVIVGKAFHHQEGALPENVTYGGFQPDMKDFYRQIKVLLVPSLVQEGFSRIILEAAANGIPTIANNIGGIPEALGDSGVLINLDAMKYPEVQPVTDCYVENIRRLFDAADEYESLCKKALQRARAYSTNLEQALSLFLHQYVR